MTRIILIACASKKLSHRAKTKDLYISPLFKYTLKYAQCLNPDKIFILSAKHGLLGLDEEIGPYDNTLNSKSQREIKEWAEGVLTQLRKVADLKKDNFIFLAGKNYRRYLAPHINNYQVPLKNMGIGEQLGFLKRKVSSSNKCAQLHHMLNNMKKHGFPFNKKEIPLNGIYVLFEKREKAHNTDRIVRIGTHTRRNQLRSRLFQHFVNENKDRSIFRKNIGRAILNKRHDSFLKQWELDLTSREAREKHSHLVDFEKQKKVEREVTKYIQDNFSFVVFRIDDKNKRLALESKIISTVSLCNQCKPSKNWLGNYSPKQKIKKSGLWLVNELYKEPLDDNDMSGLKTITG